jgi:hypothetical protein
MSETFVILLVIEIVVTAVAVALFFWRGFLDMKEEDHLLLDDAAIHLQREQAVLRARVNTLSRYIKVLGISWGVLAVVILSVWVIEGLNLL